MTITGEETLLKHTNCIFNASRVIGLNMALLPSNGVLLWHARAIRASIWSMFVCGIWGWCTLVIAHDESSKCSWHHFSNQVRANNTSDVLFSTQVSPTHTHRAHKLVMYTLTKHLRHIVALCTYIPVILFKEMIFTCTCVHTYRKQHVFLVLVYSTWIRDRVRVFEHRDRLPCQNGLVHSQCGGANGGQSDVRWNLITHWKKGKAIDKC